MSHLLDHLKNSNGTVNQGHQRKKFKGHGMLGTSTLHFIQLQFSVNQT